MWLDSSWTWSPSATGSPTKSPRVLGSPGPDRAIDPTSANRVLRGGAWNNNTNNVRSSYRNNNTPDNSNNNIGFRVASTPTRMDAQTTPRSVASDRSGEAIGVQDHWQGSGLP